MMEGRCSEHGNHHLILNQKEKADEGEPSSLPLCLNCEQAAPSPAAKAVTSLSQTCDHVHYLTQSGAE